MLLFYIFSDLRTFEWSLEEWPRSTILQNLVS